MLLCAFLAVAAIVGKVGPVLIVEKTCYRRIITGKRLHERFIRHSLPCNSLQACQHQCSIEKHFTCQGFNIRLDTARIGRGVCELSSIVTAHLDLSRDFVFDPEFAYYERNQDNDLPNCGHLNVVPNAIAPHNPEENTVGYQLPISGGPYYGGDSYGPWSTGHGTIDHGPWGSHGYGSGFYESNNPSRGPAPSFHSETSTRQDPYSYGDGYGYGYRDRWQSHGFEGEASLPRRSRPYFPPGTSPQPGLYTFGGSSQGQGFTRGGSTPIGPGTFSSPSTPGSQDSYSGYGYGYGYGYGGSSQRPRFTENTYPSRVQGPFDQPNTQRQQGPFPGYNYGQGIELYGYGGRRPYSAARPKVPDYERGKSTFEQGPPGKYPTWNRIYNRPNRIPFYIIIDADANNGNGVMWPIYTPYKPNAGYLPVGPPALPPSRPLPPSGPQLLPQPPLKRPPQPRLPLQSSRQPPPLYPFATGGSDKSGISSKSVGREVCFRREHPGFRLNSNTIRGMYEMPGILDCEAMCTNSPFKCTGYSFRYSSSVSGPNCLLTDYSSLNPEVHLLPDKSCDVYLKMGTCMIYDRVADTECFLRVATNRKLDPGKIVKTQAVSGMSDCELACLSSGFFTCRSFSFRHGPPIIGEPVENCFLSDWPMSALTHSDFIPVDNYDIYERGSFGHGCELDAGLPHIGPRPPFSPYPNIPQIPHPKDHWDPKETWRRFTVSGWPCREGTECELNVGAGFWACEVEGGDRAQWDYCCRPKHSCGFSKGYYYPWCYVGEAGPDQWRPCSEFYYPEFGNRYPYKPVQSHNSQPDDSYGPPRDMRPWNFGSKEFGPPSYWPISYMYSEPPPNETYIWDPEEHIFYHQHFEHFELHAPDYYHDQPKASPKIRFKPCGNRHPYPRAVIQKLDLKNIPKAGNPEEQSRKGEKPRVSKAEEESVFGFSPENRDKKNSQDIFASTAPTLGNLTRRETNRTNVSLHKTKEIIKEVEKIIMESTTGMEPEKNESLKKVETKHPGFFSVSLLEKKDFWN